MELAEGSGPRITIGYTYPVKCYLLMLLCRASAKQCVVLSTFVGKQKRHKISASMVYYCSIFFPPRLAHVALAEPVVASLDIWG